jgi:hypothetical protein
VNTPFGIFGRANLGPQAPTLSSELREEVMEVERDLKRLASRKRITGGEAIGKLIGATHCVTDKVFPVMFRGAAIVVSFFYPSQRVVVDIFNDADGNRKAEVEFKRELFRKNGIRYAAAWHTDEAASIAAQLL